MTGWRQVTDSLPDDCVDVWVSDNKTVGISEYIHGLEDWAYCDRMLGPITCWMPIEYPNTPNK